MMIFFTGFQTNEGIVNVIIYTLVVMVLPLHFKE